MQMHHSSCLLPRNPLVPKPASPRRSSVVIRRKPTNSVSASRNTRDDLGYSGSNPVLSLRSSVSPSPAMPSPRNLGLRPDPELGILSLLFVISVAIGSFFSLAIISLPALSAFRRLAISMDKLSKVVSEEIPGTLSSIKLSGLEINDLTQQLSNLRQRISGNR